MLIDYTNRYTAASAYAAGKPTDIQYAPTGACTITANTPANVTGVTGLTASVTRAYLKYVAYQLRVAALRKTDWVLLACLRLRQAITDLTEPQTLTTTETATGIGVAQSSYQIKILSRAEQEPTLGASIDVIQTDFGRFMVIETDYIGTTTTTNSGGALSAWAGTSGTGAGARGNAGFYNVPYAGLILKKGNLAKSWGVAPKSTELAQLGGGDNYDVKCAAMLEVRNPVLGAYWNFTGL